MASKTRQVQGERSLRGTQGTQPLSGQNGIRRVVYLSKRKSLALGSDALHIHVIPVGCDLVSYRLLSSIFTLVQTLHLQDYKSHDQITSLLLPDLSTALSPYLSTGLFSTFLHTFLQRSS